MSETSTETVPVVLAEEQLLQLAGAVAASLTAYFEAKDDEASVVIVTPVEVTVTETGTATDTDTGTDPTETTAEASA
jgi:hypothetical protein